MTETQQTLENQAKILDQLQALTAKVESLESLIRENLASGAVTGNKLQKIKPLDKLYGIYAYNPEEGIESNPYPLMLTETAVAISFDPSYLTHAFDLMMIKSEDQTDIDLDDPNVRICIREVRPTRGGNYPALFENGDISSYDEGRGIWFSSIFLTEDEPRCMREIAEDENATTVGTDEFKVEDVALTAGKIILQLDRTSHQWEKYVSNKENNEGETKPDGSVFIGGARIIDNNKIE